MSSKRVLIKVQDNILVLPFDNLPRRGSAPQLNPSRSAKTILRKPSPLKGYQFEPHKDKTFLTSIKTERESVPLRQRTPSPPDRKKAKKNESMVIVVPQLPEYSSPFKQRTVNTERTLLKPKFNSKSAVKLPPLSHNVSMLNDRNNNNQVAQMPKSKNYDYEGIESARFVPAVPWDATRNLLEKSRARILENNTNLGRIMNTEWLDKEKEREEIWGKQNEFMRRLDATRDAIRNQHRMISKYIVKNLKTIDSLEKKHYDPVKNYDGIRYLLERPMELVGPKWNTFKKNGVVYYRRRLKNEEGDEQPKDEIYDEEF